MALCLERVAGIGPASAAWKAAIITTIRYPHAILTTAHSTKKEESAQMVVLLFYIKKNIPYHVFERNFFDGNINDGKSIK